MRSSVVDLERSKSVLDGGCVNYSARAGRVRGEVVWCGVVWCGMVWYGVVWCSVVWCGVVWCGVPPC